MSLIIPFNANKKIISANEVTVDRLVAVLNCALFDAVVDDDGDAYVTDGLEFPVWISVSKDPFLVRLFTHLSHSDGRGPSIETVNKMNAAVILPQFHLDGPILCANYWLEYGAGLPIKQFVKTLRRFSAAFLEGVRLE